MNKIQSAQIKNSIVKIVFLVCSLILLSNCANFRGPASKLAKNDEKVFATPLREPKQTSQDTSTIIEDNTILQNNGLTIGKAPTLSLKQHQEVAHKTVIPTLDSNKKISRLSFNNMSVNTFINEVFGNQLGLSFAIEPKVAEAEDLVTLRLAKEMTHEELYRIATQTLAPYGVTTSLSNQVLRFSYSEEASSGDTPLLVSGRALPAVPSSNRPLFYIYPLESVSSSNIRTYLMQLFPSNELSVEQEIFSNSLILKGANHKIEQAIAAIRVFDKPVMSGMLSRIISPSVVTATELASNLELVLKNEGFSVKQNSELGASVKILPLESTGQVIVFAKSNEVLDHILNWSRTFEVERQTDIQKGLFSYQVENTLASHIVSVLNNLGVASVTGLSNSSPESTTLTGDNAPTQNRQQSFQRGRINDPSKGMYTVDEQLNTILFSGSGKEWLQVLPIIKKLDKPTPSVLVEVILIELNLDEEEESGVEFFAKTNIGGIATTLSTVDSFSLSKLGLNLFGLNSAGDTRAAISAFYKNNKANIRSRPRLMVKSGGNATINVGNSFPIVTSTIQSTESDNAPVREQVTYQDTGVFLDIKPTVHASGIVDIEINQQLSEVVDSESEGNPTLLNREISTTVTLKDGGSVLIGGLISSRSSDVEQGIPVLGKLPGIGKLFRKDSNVEARTELMVMIVPYILSSPEEAQSLTDELQNQRIKTVNNR